jgi:hypothetical protein
MSKAMLHLLGFDANNKILFLRNPEYPKVLKVVKILEQRLQRHTSCRGISCRKNTGYHTTDPKIRTQGAVRVRSRSRRNTATEASRRRRAQRTTERDTELYPGSGPSW